MSKYRNTIQYDLKTTLDKSGVTQLQTQLRQVSNILDQQIKKTENGTDEAASKALSQIKKVQDALNSSFDPKLGMLDTSKFTKEIANMNGGIQGVYNSFKKAGSAGNAAFMQMYGTMSKVNSGMKQISTTGEKVMNTIGNTARWGIVAGALGGIVNSVREAGQYIKELDTSLTNIMMVSGESRDNMNDFAKYANQAAQRLGGTTTQMTEAAKVFIQQGYNLNQSSQLGEYAVHLANVSEQTPDVTSDEITAYMNAYGINIKDISNAISKWAAVANATASDVSELSIASQKAASVAKTVGVNMDQFAAHIATIESVTREAPENIGNGLKTIYSRIADVQMGKTLDDGVNLGTFAQALQKVGVNVLDNSGNMRPVGDIIDDLMGVWGKLSPTQQAATANTVAGRYQLARFEALMNGSDIYKTALTTSEQETGTETYDKMQETYRESLQGNLNALQAAVEGVVNNLVNSNSFNDLIKGGTTLVNLIGTAANALGGLNPILTLVVGQLLKLGSKSISSGIAGFFSNRTEAKNYESNKKAAADLASRNFIQNGILDTNNQRINNAINNISSAGQYTGIMTGDQIDEYNTKIDDIIATESKYVETEERVNNALEKYNKGLALTSTKKIEFTGDTSKLVEELSKEAQTFGKDTEQASKYQKMMKDINAAAVGLNNSRQGLFQKQDKYGQYWDRTDKLNPDAKSGKIQKSFVPNAKIQVARLTELQQNYFEKGSAGYNRIGSAIAEVNKVATKQVTTYEEMSAAYNNASIKLQGLNNDINTFTTKGSKAVETAQTFSQELEKDGAACSAAGKSLREFGEGLELQKKIHDFTDTLSSMMDAMFFIQSIGNIGSIVSNDDISSTEKFEQIMVDIGIAGTSLIPILKNVKLAIEEIGVAGRTATLATGVIGAAITAIGVAIAWLTSTLNKQKDAMQDQIDTMNKAKENADSAKQSADDWEKLYDQYKKTGEVSDEFRESSDKLVDTLGIQGSKALETANAFDTLAQKVKNAKDESEQKAINAAKDALTGEREKDINGGWLTGGQLYNDSMANDIRNAISRAQSYGYNANTGQTQGWVQDLSNLKMDLSDPYKAVGSLKKSMQELEDQKESLDKQFANNTDSQEYKDQVNSINSAIKELKDAYNADDVQAVDNAAKQIGEARVQMSDFQKAMKGAKDDSTDLYNVFTKDNDMTKYISTLSSETEKWQFILNNCTTSANKLAASIGYAASKVQEGITQDQANNFVNGWSAADTQNGRNMQSAVQQAMNDNPGMNQDQASKAITQAMIAKGIEQVKNANISDSEKAQILNSVDWSGSIDQILQTLGQGAIKDAGERKIAEQHYTDQSVEQTPDYQTSAMKRYDIDEDVVDTYSQELKKNTDLAKNEDDYTAAIKRNREAIKERQAEVQAARSKSDDGEAYTKANNALKKQTKSLEENKKALKSQSEQAKDLARDNAIIQKGLESLASGWKENSEVLKKADKNSYEYAKALDNVKQSVADILLVEKDDLSNEFIEKNLGSIRKVAKGDISALNDLRAAAGKDIVVGIYEKADSTLTPKHMDYLKKKADELAHTDIEVGANINDKEFIKKIDDMAKHGELSAQDIEKYFNAIGWDPEIGTKSKKETVYSTKPTTFTIPSISYETPNIGTFLGLGEGASTTLHTDPIEIPIPGMNIQSVVTYPYVKNKGTTRLGGYHSGSSGGMSGVSSYTPSSKSTGGKKKSPKKGGRSSTPVAKKQADTSTIDKVEKMEYEKPKWDPYQLNDDRIAREDDAVEKITDKIDTLTKKFDKLTTAQSKLQMQEERLIGVGYEKNIQKQNINLNKQIDNLAKQRKELSLQIEEEKKYQKLYSQRAAIAQKESKKARKSLNKEYDLDSGDYNKDGSLKESAKKRITKRVTSEYKQAVKTYNRQRNNTSGYNSAKSQINSLTKQYNALTKSSSKSAKARRREISDEINGLKKTESASKSSYNKTMKRLEKIVDKRKKAVDDVEDKIDNYNDNQDKLRDAREQQVKISNTLLDLEQQRNEAANEQLQKQYEMEDNLIELWEKTRDARKEFVEIREQTAEIQKNLQNLFGTSTLKQYQDASATLKELLNPDLSNVSKEANKMKKGSAKNAVQGALGESSKSAYNKDFTVNIGGTEFSTLSDIGRNYLTNQQLINRYNSYRDNNFKGYLDDTGHWITNGQKLMEEMQTAIGDTNDFVSKLSSAVNELHQSILGLIDDVENEYEKRSEQYGLVQQYYQYISDMQTLIYGDKAYNQQAKVISAQLDANRQQAADLHQVVNSYKLIVENLKQKVAADKDNKDLQEELQEAQSKYNSAVQNELSMRKQITQELQQQMQVLNNQAIKNWEDQFTSTVNGVQVPLEYAAEQWERINENAGLYLDDLNKAYQIEKLQSKYQELLDNNTDANIQKQITNQMNEQLGLLRNKSKLSQYEVNYANAQLEILQKTIALQEAQQNKNSMRLRRDTQGNYQYVYSANRENVEKAQDDLLDSQMNAYNMAKQQNVDDTQAYINKIQNMASQMQKISNDMSLDAKQKQALLQDIIDSGYEYLNAKGEQLNEAQQNMIQSFIDAATKMQDINASDVKEISQRLQDGTTTNLAEVDARVDTSVGHWVDKNEETRAAAQQTADDIIQNVNDFTDAINAANNDIGGQLSDMSNSFGEASNQLQDLTNSAREFYSYLDSQLGNVDKATTELSDYSTSLAGVTAGYQNQISQLSTDNQALQAQIAQSNAIANASDESTWLGSIIHIKEPMYMSYSRDNTQTDKANHKGKKGNTIKAGYYKITHYLPNEANPFGLVHVTKDGKEVGQTTNDKFMSDYKNGHSDWTTRKDQEKWTSSDAIKKYVLAAKGFKSGGYTGTWTDGMKEAENGKVAILHQKEMVLNQKDSANMLLAVFAVRDMIKDFKNNNISDMLSTFGRNIASANSIDNDKTIQQRVEVTANFPNANNAEEIKQAILGLADTTYSYASNKNMPKGKFI